MIADFLQPHIVHDPHRAHPGQHRRYIAVEAGAVGKAVAPHMREPRLRLAELIKLSLDPLLVGRPVDQALLESEGNAPIIWGRPRNRSFAFARLDVLFGVILLADEIMSAGYRLIDQLCLGGSIGKIEGYAIGLIQDGLRQSPVELWHAMPEH